MTTNSIIKEIEQLKFDILSSEEIRKKYPPQPTVKDEVKNIMDENFSHLTPFQKQEMEITQNYLVNQRRKEFKERVERRTIVFEKVYSLDEIHIKKPKINDYSSTSGKTYIKYIKDLFNISEDKAINILKNFNGDVYNTILFHNSLN